MVNKAKKFILGLEWKRALRISLAVLLVNPAPLGVGVISARAQSVPAMMNFQGRLTDSLNNPLDGPYDFNFKIFDDPTAGTQLWEESQPGVAVANGVLAVRLGSVTPLTTSVFYNGAAYLEIKVGTDVLSPRERLITSPYAFGAKLLEGRSYDAFVSTDATAQTILGNKTFSGTVSVPEPAANSHAATKFYVDGQVASGGSGWIKDGSVVKLVASGDAVVVQSTLTVQGDAFSVGVSTLVVKDGRVGVGTINPGQPLEVNGTAQASRVFGTYTGSGGVFLAPGATGLSPQYTFVGSQGNGLGFEGQSTVLQGGWQSAESGIIFKTGTGSPTEWMRLNATGSVGIGTTAAQEKLHVSSGSAVVDFGIRTSTLTFAAGLTADPAPASGMLYYNAASNKLRLYNGAWADVTTGLSGDYVARTGDSMTGQLTVRGASVEVSSITTLGAIGIGGIGLSAGTLVVKSTSTDATNPVVNVQNFAGSELMRVQQDGKVGIGTTSPAQKLHVEGLCVAGDTLIPVLRAKTSVREIPITEIKPGDRVFSLNEKNSQIEPHPVKGLLYIGVKPVFRLTTASGRSIRTTGNHPYLTRSGWRKVVEIQVGEEIAVPGLEKPYWNSSKPSGLSTTSLPESLSGGIPVSREFSEEAMSSQYGGWKSIWMIPAHRDGGYRMVSVKSASRVIKSLFSWIASRMTEPFLSPSGTLFASWPSFFRNGRILTGTSSSMRNRMMGGSERNETAPLNALTREGQGGPDVRPGQGRIAGSDLSKTRPVLQELEDGRNHDARTLEAGLSVANLRVYGYKIPPVHSPSHPTNSLPTASKDVKEMRPPAVHWERIASIEPLGQEPVWDIEVERTHNFIGNRIFAHNTYMSGNVGIGTTSPAQKVHVSSGTLLVDGDASTAFKVGVSSFIINSEGRVGIGTTQPPTQLAIYHTTNAKAFIGVPTATDPDGSTTHKLLMGDSAGTGSGQLHLVTKTASANAWIGSVNFTNYNEATSLKNLASIVGQTDSAANKGRIGFWTTASGANNIVERMRIDGSGNVGIGTTDPQEKLHVSYGNAVVDYGIRTSTLTFAAGLTGDPATPASGMLYYNASTNKLRLYDGSWKDLATGSTGDYVSKAGDSMTGQLTVLGSSITIVDTNVGGSGDKYSLAVTTAPDRSVYHLYVSTTGRVGIGTSSVNSRSLFSVNGLTLYGKADQSNALVINNPGESWMIMRGIGSLGGWSALEMGYASTIDGTPTNILTLRDNGRAGIGTQSPAAKLDVNGGMIVRSSVTLAGISTTPNSAAGQGALYFDTEDGKFKVSENGGSFADLVNQASAGGWTDDGTVVRLSTLGDAVVVGNAATASSVTVTGALGIGGVGLSAGTLVVKSTSTDATNPVVNVQNNAGTELMRVQVDGKVGVGTTSPVEKLEVN
ncbi:MAG: hypothetical protein HY748_02745, partial [Elusimicrobia bacterium]|nr:hypothetical protein [Elusimicrobiota bacterium]